MSEQNIETQNGGLPVGTSVSPLPFKDDVNELNYGREHHTGTFVPSFRQLQTPPFFFTRDKWPLTLVDRFKGGSAFLIAGGPSFKDIDATKLRLPGILTMGMNNSPKSFRPDLWTCVDDPGNFMKSIWLDPSIEKIVPISHVNKHLWDNWKWRQDSKKVGDCPNVAFYKRNEKFRPQQYLWEDSINWGNSGNNGGGRSVMLAAVRILFLMGIRRLFLLGVDFNMSETSKYHFEQDRAAGSIKGNNNTYRHLNERFKILRPLFEEQDYRIYNCNPDSGLKAFDHMPFEEAIQFARGKDWPDQASERTEGMYDRKAKERERMRNAPKPKATVAINKPTGGCQNCSRRHLDQLKAQINVARTTLYEGKDKLEAAQGDPLFDASRLEELEREVKNKRRVYEQLLKVRNDIMNVRAAAGPKAQEEPVANAA